MNEIAVTSPCVVVGNGPSLIGGELGKYIDAHDCVVRLNNFALGGYQKDVGSKTDIWVQSFGDVDWRRTPSRDPRGSVLFWWPPNLPGLFGEYKKRAEAYHPFPIEIMPFSSIWSTCDVVPEHWNYNGKSKVPGKGPSLGALSLTHFVLSFGCSVDCVGIGDMGMEGAHYWNELTSCSKHSSEAEALFLERMQGKRRINLVRPE